jgi:hypothetical protein
VVFFFTNGKEILEKIYRNNLNVKSMEWNNQGKMKVTQKFLERIKNNFPPW